MNKKKQQQTNKSCFNHVFFIHVMKMYTIINLLENLFLKTLQGEQNILIRFLKGNELHKVRLVCSFHLFSVLIFHTVIFLKID